MVHGSGRTQRAGCRFVRSLAAVAWSCGAWRSRSRRVPLRRRTPTRTRLRRSARRPRAIPVRHRERAPTTRFRWVRIATGAWGPHRSLRSARRRRRGRRFPAVPGVVEGSFVDALGVDRTQEPCGTAATSGAGEVVPPASPAADAPSMSGGSFGRREPVGAVTEDSGGVGWWLMVTIAVAAASGFGLPPRHVAARDRVGPPIRDPRPPHGPREPAAVRGDARA